MWKPHTGVGIDTYDAQLARVLVSESLRRKIKLLILVRRAAEYQISGTIPVIVSNLLATKKIGGFLFKQKIRRLKYENKLRNRTIPYNFLWC